MTLERSLSVPVLLMASLLGGIVAVPEARAHEISWMDLYVSPGVAFAVPTGHAPSYGAGFELTAGYTGIVTASRWRFPHAGALYRHQPSSRGSLDTLGLQGGIGPLDLELGWGFRGDSVDRAPAGLHVAALLSLGVLYAGPQWIVPTGGGPSECVIGIGIKFPLPHIVLIPALASIDWGKMVH